MACIEVSRTALVTTGKGKVGMVVASVDIVMFSLDPDHVFLEGDIMRNRVSIGFVDGSEFGRRTESR